MARRKKSGSSGASLDSLLDTMTNVVGILVIMLVVTQLSASDATRRIKEFVKEYTQEELEQIMAEADKLDQTVQDTDLKLVEIEKENPEKKKELDLKKQEIAKLLKELEQLSNMKIDPAELKKQIELRKTAIAKIEERIKKEEDQIATLKSQLAKTPAKGPDPDAKIVNLPNPQPAPEGAIEIKFLCMDGKIFPLDPAMIANFQSRTQKKMKQVSKLFVQEDGKIDCTKLKVIFENTIIQDRLFRVKVGSYESRKDPYMVLEPFLKEGESLERISRGTSAYRNAIRKMNSQKVWVRFYVWSDSFETYLMARSIAEQQGLSAGWVPRDGAKNFIVDISFNKEIRDQLVCLTYKAPAPREQDPNAPKLPRDDVD